MQSIYSAVSSETGEPVFFVVGKLGYTLPGSVKNYDKDSDARKACEAFTSAQSMGKLARFVIALAGVGEPTADQYKATVKALSHQNGAAIVELWALMKETGALAGQMRKTNGAS